VQDLGGVDLLQEVATFTFARVEDLFDNPITSLLANSATSEADNWHAGGKAPTILVVDDEKLIADTITEIL
jgi:hypothetical protein